MFSKFKGFYQRLKIVIKRAKKNPSLFLLYNEKTEINKMKNIDISEMRTVNVSLGRRVGVESKDNYRSDKYLYIWLQM